MTAQPITLPRIRKRLDAIRTWLSGMGAEVMVPTNEWELLRFRANGQTSIVYHNLRGNLTMTGDADVALNAFFTAGAWHANGKTRRWKSSTDVQTIRARDGDDCFACCWPVQQTDETVDHLVAVAHGGPNHISNKVLMHADCNRKCGHMSAPEKVRMHVEALIAKAMLR